MSRLVAFLLILLASIAPAASQQLPGGAAPPVHPGTKLNFPPTIGGAQLERSYTQPIGRDVHYVYGYSADKLHITVFLFDGGRRVPEGPDNPTVISQFGTEIEATEKAAKSDGYTGFEKPSVPSACTFGSITFRCVVYSAATQHGRVFSKLMMTGYRDYFLKVRIDWAQSLNQTSADADRALRTFIPALVH
jgi:hypothetical protein